MRVITNAKSTTATHDNPAYRSSVADYSLRQIRLIQDKRAGYVASASVADNPPQDSVVVVDPDEIGVPTISELIAGIEDDAPSPLGFAWQEKQTAASKEAGVRDSLAIATEALRNEPSPLDITHNSTAALPSAAISKSTLGLDISPVSGSDISPDISPASHGSTNQSVELSSPATGNIWQLDPDHGLANIGLAFGLSSSPNANMSGSAHNYGQSYGWSSTSNANGGASDRATYGSTNFHADRFDDVNSRSFSYPGATSYPPPLTLNPSYQSPTFQTAAPYSANTPRSSYDYGGINPARLNASPNYGRDRELPSNYAKMSPQRSPLDSPMTSHAYTPSYAELGRGTPNAGLGGNALGIGASGSMSAREATFDNPFNAASYANSRLRRHSDEDPNLNLALGARFATGGGGAGGLGGGDGAGPSGGNAVGKRKATWSGAETDLASIKQELEFLERTEREVAEMKNDLPSGDRKERRRMQNRLAQRAFRARSKVHHQEVSKHITDLEDTVDSQGDHIDKLMALVERLQTENMLLRKATDWSRLGVGNDTPRLDDPRPPPPL